MHEATSSRPRLSIPTPDALDQNQPQSPLEAPGVHVPRTFVLRAAQTACAGLVALLWVLPTTAQDVTEPALRAAFIYNIATFTKWPVDALPPATPTVMCVLGDEPIAAALERSVKGRLNAGHPIKVSRVTVAGGLSGCHLAYMSHISPVQAAQVIAGLREQPVLTLSDLEGFQDLGGMVRFNFDRGRIVFSVNVKAAKPARLDFSAKLLKLAKKP
jgi:hypothetical protein